MLRPSYSLPGSERDRFLRTVSGTDMRKSQSPGGISQTQQAQMLRDFVTAWSKLSFAGPAYVYIRKDAAGVFYTDWGNRTPPQG